MNVDVYRDDQGQTHFVVYVPGVPNGRQGAALCGRSTEAMESAAWFPVGDPRGRVHYARACSECSEGLSE